MGRYVIVAYKPKPGKEERLHELVRNHLNILQEEKLATSRPANIMKASDGTVIEVFEWASPAAIEKAHNNITIQNLWKEFGEACNYLPLNQLSEANNIFAEFDAMN